MRTLALFDFDGTLYKKDSLIEFTKFAKGETAFYKGMLMILPNLVGLKLNLLPNEKVKIKFLTHFFKGMDAEKFRTLASDFARHKIASEFDSKIFCAFQKHIEARDTVYIVSASFAEWIEPWSSQYGVQVIGTQLEMSDQKITGKLASKNCYGPEKVYRIMQILNLEDFDIVNVYGSGKGDREMLLLAKNGA